MSTKTVKKVVKSKAKGAIAKAKPLKPTPVKKIKYKPSIIDKFIPGEKYSCSTYSMHRDVIFINGVKFTIYSDSDISTACKFAVGQDNEHIILTECSKYPGDIRERLKDLVEEKHKKDKYTDFYEWFNFIKHNHHSNLVNYVGCGSSIIKDKDRKGQIEDFIKTLKKMPIWKDCKKFYRGMRFYTGSSENEKLKAFLNNKKVGSTIKIDCITSVSSSKKIACAFSRSCDSYKGILMEIEARSVRKVDYNTGEREGLLLKGTKLIIKDIRKKGNKTFLKLVEK